MLGVVTSKDRVWAWFEGSADKIGEVAIVAILGLAKAWNRYADRREKARTGRRSTDVGTARTLKAIGHVYDVIVELQKTLTRLEARVKTLEHKAAEDTKKHPR